MKKKTLLSKRFHLLAVIVGFCLLTACAQTTNTKSTSFFDPAYQGQNFSSIIVSAEGLGLSERHAIEGEAVNALRAQGIRAMAGGTLFPPTRDYTNDAKRRMANETGYEAVLTITNISKDIHHDFVESAPFEPRGSVYGGSGYYGSGVGVGLGFPLGRSGTVYKEPEATYRASLHKLPSYQKLWIGEFSTRGPNGMEWSDVGRNFADYLVRKMVSDGLIQPSDIVEKP